jgi:hypothetical protein
MTLAHYILARNRIFPYNPGKPPEVKVLASMILGLIFVNQYLNIIKGWHFCHRSRRHPAPVPIEQTAGQIPHRF